MRSGKIIVIFIRKLQYHFQICKWAKEFTTWASERENAPIVINSIMKIVTFE